LDTIRFGLLKFLNNHLFPVSEGLEGLGSFRLLLVDEPGDGVSPGIKPATAQELISELNIVPLYTSQ
jgi:hypothetical protein